MVTMQNHSEYYVFISLIKFNYTVRMLIFRKKNNKTFENNFFIPSLKKLSIVIFTKQYFFNIDHSHVLNLHK